MLEKRALKSLLRNAVENAGVHKKMRAKIAERIKISFTSTIDEIRDIHFHKVNEIESRVWRS